MIQKTKIIFFIGTLCAGGKERRLVELLTYLKNNTEHEMLVVLRQDQIDYPAFFKLNVPYKILTVKYIKKDLRLPFQFYKICSEFKPDIIHTWGSMPASVALPTVIVKRIPHVNSQITSAPPRMKKWSFSALQNKINFSFSDVILSNSKAGLESFKPQNNKSQVIYNGVNFDRFKDLPDPNKVREKYNIGTPFSVIMVASFTENKDYRRYIKIAEEVISARKDISFICVGDGPNLSTICEKAKNNDKIIFTGRINDVESLINACDIGVLFSPNGEGISNSILEYMALGKPAIATNTGGTKEIIDHKVTGYLINNESIEEIAKLIINLVDDQIKRATLGSAGRTKIESQFSLTKMGNEFVDLFQELINIRNNEALEHSE